MIILRIHDQLRVCLCLHSLWSRTLIWDSIAVIIMWDVMRYPPLLGYMAAWLHFARIFPNFNSCCSIYDAFIWKPIVNLHANQNCLILCLGIVHVILFIIIVIIVIVGYIIKRGINKSPISSVLLYVFGNMDKMRKRRWWFYWELCEHF